METCLGDLSTMWALAKDQRRLQLAAQTWSQLAGQIFVRPKGLIPGDVISNTHNILDTGGLIHRCGKRVNESLLSRYAKRDNKTRINAISSLSNLIFYLVVPAWESFITSGRNSEIQPFSGDYREERISSLSVRILKLLFMYFNISGGRVFHFTSTSHIFPLLQNSRRLSFFWRKKFRNINLDFKIVKKCSVGNQWPEKPGKPGIYFLVGEYFNSLVLVGKLIKSL